MRFALNARLFLVNWILSLIHFKKVKVFTSSFLSSITEVLYNPGHNILSFLMLFQIFLYHKWNGVWLFVINIVYKSCQYKK